MVEERIAVLEEKAERHEKAMEKVLAKLEEMDDTLTRYKGFLGGVMFVGSCLWAFILFGKDWVFKKFFGV